MCVYDLINIDVKILGNIIEYNLISFFYFNILQHNKTQSNRIQHDILHLIQYHLVLIRSDRVYSFM